MGVSILHLDTPIAYPMSALVSPQVSTFSPATSGGGRLGVFCCPFNLLFLLRFIRNQNFPQMLNPIFPCFRQPYRGGLPPSCPIDLAQALGFPISHTHAQVALVPPPGPTQLAIARGGLPSAPRLRCIHPCSQAALEPRETRGGHAL